MVDTDKAAPAPPPRSDDYVEEELTYVPSDGDPPRVKWRGMTFEANKPVKIREKKIVDPETGNKVLPKDSHIESAKGNPWFKLSSQKDSGPPKQNQTIATPEQYKKHVADWLQKVEHVDELAGRWAREQNLRSAAQVGEEDVLYLGTLIEPVLRRVQASDGMNDSQMASVFVNHGLTSIPWRR